MKRVSPCVNLRFGTCGARLTADERLDIVVVSAVADPTCGLGNGGHRIARSDGLPIYREPETA